jgi:hypothetical protein
VRRLLADPALRAAQGAAARALVEQRYSAAFVGQQLSDLFESCVPEIAHSFREDRRVASLSDR